MYAVFIAICRLIVEKHGETFIMGITYSFCLLISFCCIAPLHLWNMPCGTHPILMKCSEKLVLQHMKKHHFSQPGLSHVCIQNQQTDISAALCSVFTHLEKNKKNNTWTGIQQNLPHETHWQTPHSGLEYHTRQLNIGLPHKQTQDSWDWQSHLLHSNVERRSPPGCCAQAPPVHNVHS